MSYCHLAAVTGSVPTRAALLYDICRRLPAGRWHVHDGHHWLTVRVNEAGEVINRARNTPPPNTSKLEGSAGVRREKPCSATGTRPVQPLLVLLGPINLGPDVFWANQAHS